MSREHGHEFLGLFFVQTPKEVLSLIDMRIGGMGDVHYGFTLLWILGFQFVTGGTAMKFVAFVPSMSEKITLSILWSSLLPKIGVVGSLVVDFISKHRFTKPSGIFFWLSCIPLALFL